MIAIVLQNGSELKSVEVNNLKFKVISLHQRRKEKVIKLHMGEISHGRLLVSSSDCNLELLLI